MTVGALSVLTNRMGLPAQLLAAIKNDKYDNGGSDITVTGLIQPPQIRYLKRLHGTEEDASDRIWSLIGQATHTILERAFEGDELTIVERRFHTEEGGWKVSGQVDVFELAGVLSDWKITSVWSKDGKEEWEQQLNLLRLLLVRHGYTVDKLQVVAIFRDWQKAKRREEGYPESQVKVIPLKVWPIGVAEGYLKGRLELHQAETPRPCTDEDRWMRPEKFAVMKKGRKSAVKLFDDRDSANKFIERSADKNQLQLIHRTKTYTRCEGYCPVSGVCPQWKAEQDAKPF